MRYAFWIAFMMAMIALSECASSQVLPFDSTRKPELTFPLHKWEDPHYYVLPAAWDSTVELSTVDHMIDTCKSLSKPWKLYNKMIARSERGMMIYNNPLFVDWMKEAMLEYPHPIFVYCYCLADGRETAMSTYKDYVISECPELHEMFGNFQKIFQE